MNEKELIEYVDHLCGLKLKGAILNCQAVSRISSKSFYIEVKLLPDKEQMVIDNIHKLFGIGTEPENISIPRANNPVCQGMREKKIKEAFVKFMKGEGMAKTSTIKLLIAEDEQKNLYLYIY